MKKKLKIAVWHNLPSGGGKRQLYNHVKGLLGQGHYIESWCPDTADQSFLPLNALVPEYIIPLKFPNNFNRRSIYEVIKSYNTVKILAEALDEHNKECARQINNGDFDVLYANACMFFRTSSIGKHIQIPSSIYLGEPYRWFYEAMPELAWLPQNINDLQNNGESIRGVRFQAYNELNYAKAFNILLTNSIYSRETILRVYNLESKVCYLGIDTDFYKPTTQRKENFVVGLGTIYHAKGVDRAINALGTIPKKIRPNLIWIGNGAWQNDLNRYHALSNDLGVNFSTKINISDDEVKSLLSRASLMLYTSRLEPFGLAPLEANACGTPVVGIAEGGAKETIVDGVNGYLVNDDAPKLIGEKIVAIMTDQTKLTEFSNTCRNHIVTRWNLEMSTSNIERYLCTLKDIEEPDSLKVNTNALSHYSPQDPFIQEIRRKHWKWWLRKLLPPIIMDIYRIVEDKGNDLKNSLYKI